MKKLIGILILSLSSIASFADVTCSGVITDLVKWNDKNLAVLLENTGRWIQLPGDSESNSMALAAFVAQKRVAFYWADSQVTGCNEGWEHYREFEGYFRVTN